MRLQTHPKGEDAYKLLGITANANEADIVNAYRRAAMRCHPDRNPNDPDATKKFQAIQAAYKHLLKHHKTLPSLADLDELVSKAEAESDEAAEEKQAAQHAFGDDIPYRALLIFWCGVASFFYFEFAAAVLLFSLALFLALAAYHPPQSILGLKIKRHFKQAVQFYFMALLAAAVLYLFSRLSPSVLLY